VQNVRFLLSGDKALTVEFGNEISPEINAKVRAYTIALGQSGIGGIVETVPTYRSLIVHYRPEVIGYDALTRRLEEVLERLGSIEIPPAKVVELPVLYGGEEGPDLEFVAEYCAMTPDEVVAVHSAPEYLIYMIGFTLGFAYLGGMDKRIAVPRLKSPRVKIPAGSVGIAGEQTGAYSVESPGGWRLIGLTPVWLYDPRREKPVLLEPGQYLKFRPIGREEYLHIRSRAQSGDYECRVYDKEGV
jgi:KipI family sensor histidine kinase inhibitor